MGTSLKGKQRVITISATGYKEMTFSHILNAYAYLHRITKANLNKVGQTTIKIKTTSLPHSTKAKTPKIAKAKTPKVTKAKVTKATTFKTKGKKQGYFSL